MFKQEDKLDRDMNSVYFTMDYQLFIMQHGDLIILDNDEIPVLIRKLEKLYEKWRDYKHVRANQQRLIPIEEEIKEII